MLTDMPAFLSVMLSSFITAFRSANKWGNRLTVNPFGKS